MSKLKLGLIADDKRVRVTADLPAEVHRDLVAYAEALAAESGQAVEPAKLVAPMLMRFMATDRGFRRVRRGQDVKQPPARPEASDPAGQRPGRE